MPHKPRPKGRTAPKKAADTATADPNEFTLRKADAAKILGKSERTVAYLMSSGKLPVGYVSGPTGRQAMLRRADVERIKKEFETPIVVTGEGGEVAAPPAAALVRMRAGGDPFTGIMAQLAAFARAFPAPASLADVARPWLTVKEAAAWTGLPARWLLEKAKAGELRAVNVGLTRESWRFSRDGLK